jgi:ketosteroid isomerase-like protein
MSASEAALRLAQAYVRSVEAKDLAAVASVLADDARQIFMHSSKVRKPKGMAEIKAGDKHGFCVASLLGKDEILGYTEGLIKNFGRLIWVDQEWTSSDNGEAVLFSATGDMVTAKSGKAYRNGYVMQFSVERDRITRIIEFGDAFLYARLLIPPSKVQLRAFRRAFARFIPFR